METPGGLEKGGGDFESIGQALETAAYLVTIKNVPIEKITTAFQPLGLTFNKNNGNYLWEVQNQERFDAAMAAVSENLDNNDRLIDLLQFVSKAARDTVVTTYATGTNLNEAIENFIYLDEEMKAWGVYAKIHARNLDPPLTTLNLDVYKFITAGEGMVARKLAVAGLWPEQIDTTLGEVKASGLSNHLRWSTTLAKLVQAYVTVRDLEDTTNGDNPSVLLNRVQVLLTTEITLFKTNVEKIRDRLHEDEDATLYKKYSELIESSWRLHEKIKDDSEEEIVLSEMDDRARERLEDDKLYDFMLGAFGEKLELFEVEEANARAMPYGFSFVVQGIGDTELSTIVGMKIEDINEFTRFMVSYFEATTQPEQYSTFLELIAASYKGDFSDPVLGSLWFRLTKTLAPHFAEDHPDTRGSVGQIKKLWKLPEVSGYEVSDILSDNLLLPEVHGRDFREALERDPYSTIKNGVNVFQELLDRKEGVEQKLIYKAFAWFKKEVAPYLTVDSELTGGQITYIKQVIDLLSTAIMDNES